MLREAEVSRLVHNYLMDSVLMMFAFSIRSDKDGNSMCVTGPLFTNGAKAQTCEYRIRCKVYIRVATFVVNFSCKTIIETDLNLRI